MRKIHPKAIPYEIERYVFKETHKFFNLRPASHPFLSGDTYRNFASVLYDETRKCQAKDINKNDIVFVSSRFLFDFSTKVLPEVMYPFIMITHQSDTNITNTNIFLEIAENKNITHWFAQNCTLQHKKVTPLPIGLEDAWRHNAGIIKDFNSIINQKEKTKIPKVVIAFNVSTNMNERSICAKSFENKECSAKFDNVCTCREYRKLLSNYCFVASPEGNGLDCHRTWESIYLKVVPILLKNYMTEFFQSLNLPIWVVDSWEEVTKLSLHDLEKKYHQIMNTSTVEPAKFEYWKEKILSYKI